MLRAMATCSFCGARKGKRPCPALGGEVCPQCCGKHRLAEINCPSDCRFLGGLAVVREPGAPAFTRDEYHAATARLAAHIQAPQARGLWREALAYLLDTDPRPQWEREGDPIPTWMQTLLLAWLGYGHHGAGGKRALDAYLDRHARGLPPGEVAALVALQRSWPSLFEVTNVRPGDGMTVRDLVLDATHEVRDATASAELRRGMYFLAFLVPVDDALELAADCVLVPRELVASVRAALADELAARRAERPDVDPKVVLRHRLDLALGAMRAGLARRPAAPAMRTSDGEALLASEAHYRLADADAARAALAAVPDVEAEGDGAAPTRLVWLTPADPADPDGPRGVLGTIKLRGDQLVLETVSRERLARGRALLERHLGQAIVHRTDAFTDPVALIPADDAAAGAGPASAADVVSADHAPREAIAAMLAQHYRRWLDLPVPALDDQTPRAAARTDAGRARVAALLDDMERDSAGQPGATAALWNELRRALGVDERALAGAGLVYDPDVAPPPAAWLAAEEETRIDAILAYHVANDEDLTEADEVHAGMHDICENQLAAGHPPETAAALARLIAAGVTRHDAIHAIGSVLAAELHAIVTKRRAYDHASVARGLAALRPSDWLGPRTPGG